MDKKEIEIVYKVDKISGMDSEIINFVRILGRMVSDGSNLVKVVDKDHIQVHKDN